ncbi:hypothetical protein [Thauera butanivorans]|uniref:hypothetical protein n=1 Tax=Thauera butanivorans TaxID=86174 RepID=UPI0008381883|nr:hypothetical protein [Thauera butanivorans]
MAAQFWNEDDEKAHRAFILESARIEERSALQAAKKEAYIETALKMIAANRFDDATIAEFSGLTEDEVRRLREQA